MPYFNLTSEEVINSFSGAISGDFATYVSNGVEIIEEEMDFQYEKLLTQLNSTLLSYMEEVNYEIVDVDANYQFSAGLPPINGSVEAWRISKSGVPCKDCWDADDKEPITQIGVNLFETVDKTWDRDLWRIVIKYKVDSDLLEFKVLKSVLRHMVCCALGNKIFPSVEGDTWSIVKYHCEEAEKWLEIIKKHMPSEVKKMKMLYPPLPWSSISVRRVN